MQLNPRKPGIIAAGLSALSINLLTANAALAQDRPAAPPGLMQEAAPEPGSVVLDSSVLFYQESGGRVRAIEPVINGEIHLQSGSVISGGLTYDALTGATPNGAAPWSASQSFTSIVPAPTIGQTTTTSASGTKTVIPGTGTASSIYTTPAGRIPLSGFHDHRFAVNLGYAWLAGADTHLNVGGAFSKETDYTTFTASAGIARDFNDKNTTLSLNGSFEEDISYPHIRTPAPFQRLDSLVTGANGHKSVITGMVGLTQTLTRTWLTQLNLGYSTDNGYQSDPYRVISAVDGTTGAPFLYLFESRPRSRQRYNVYWGNKVALGPTVLDVSARYYHDTWGINSITAEVSEQVPITRWLYVKPTFRYYHQGAANFYKPWLTGVGTQTTVTHTPGGEEGGGTTTTSTIVTGLPAYASSDSRLSRFNAVTIGGRIGWRLFANSEFYIDGEIYRQSGAHTVPGAPGGLAGLDVFSGVKAVSVMSGLRIKM